jgi:hypothetical protein
LAACALAACGGSGDSAVSQPAIAGVETGPLKVVGGGATSYRKLDHHVYVVEWAEEGDMSELRAAATVEHEYLLAAVEGNWIEACGHISEILLQTLPSQPAAAGKGCAAPLATYAAPRIRGLHLKSSEVEAESLRSDGGWAFLLYRAAANPYYMPMVLESGEWKVNHAAPVAFEG